MLKVAEVILVVSEAMVVVVEAMLVVGHNGGYFKSSL